MQDLVEFKTPTGFTFHLKPELTYGEFNEVQKVITSHVDFDLQTQQPKNFKANALFEAQKKTIEFIVKKATDPNGKEITNIQKSIDDLPRKDGQALMDKINELTADSQVDKKKGA